MFEYREDKEERDEVAIGSDARETPIHETTWEGINDLLVDGDEVDDDRIQSPEKKIIPKGDNYRPLYKEGCKWIGIYHRSA